VPFSEQFVDKKAVCAMKICADRQNQKNFSIFGPDFTQ